MAKRKYKKQHRAAKNIAYFALALVVLIISYFLKPWDYIGDKADLSTAIETDPTQLAVYFIDVAQADSALVKLPTGENVLIDAGCEKDTDAETIDKYIDFIKDQDVEKIDYLFLTHPHYDHIGAADEVIKEFEIGDIILPDCAPSSWKRVLTAMEEKNLTYSSPEVGTIYNIGGASFKILAPSQNMLDRNEVNSYSLIIKMVYGETSFVFTGDAEKDSEKEVVAAFSSELSCDVLKVGHHGSDTSSSAEFLRATSPSVAVISVGKDNSYRHPNDDVLERLAKNTTAQVLRTDEEGTIVFNSDGKTITRVVTE